MSSIDINRRWESDSKNGEVLCTKLQKCTIYNVWRNGGRKTKSDSNAKCSNESITDIGSGYISCKG